jgi:hypothetical protein
VAAGTGFASKIALGSRVFVTNVQSGSLRLLGAFTLRRIQLRDAEGKPPGATWDAPEYLLAEEGSSAPLQVRSVPADVVGQLRFISSGSADGRVALNADGSVNGQAMRSPRELTSQSALLLESLLGVKQDRQWTEEELRASVQAYLDMAERSRRGERVVKSQYYATLSARFNRSPAAFEYRMQNISYVLTLLGRDWVAGLAPAKNVGTHVAGEIERLIAEAEGTQPTGQASEAIQIAESRGSQRSPPVGTKTPAVISTVTTSRARDLQVKAWVLDRAAGACEACLEPAPFVGTNGFPFLEVHHVRHLADGGSDSPTNALAVCPNCHRRLHHSRDAHEYREGIWSKVSVLVRE